MKLSPVAGSGESAFTLLELIIASLMFSIMMASISTAFFGAYQLRETNTRDLRGEHQVRRAIQIIKRDLRSATLPSTNDTSTINIGSEDETNTVQLAGAMFTDTGETLGSQTFSFYTGSGVMHTNLPWSEIQYVSYSLRAVNSAEATNGLQLVRGVIRNLLTDGTDDYQEQLLLSGIQTMAIEFFDGSTWLDYWDSTTLDPQSPRAVRMVLDMVPETEADLGRRVSVVAPVSVEVLTNTIAAPNVQEGNG